jgi:hypothetical protein
MGSAFDGSASAEVTARQGVGPARKRKQKSQSAGASLAPGLVLLLTFSYPILCNAWIFQSSPVSTNWLRSAAQLSGQQQQSKPSAATKLSQAIAEPHRFVVVITPDSDHTLASPPWLIDLAMRESILLRKTRGMGANRLNQLSGQTIS